MLGSIANPVIFSPLVVILLLSLSSKSQIDYDYNYFIFAVSFIVFNLTFWFDYIKIFPVETKKNKITLATISMFSSLLASTVIISPLIFFHGNELVSLCVVGFLSFSSISCIVRIKYYNYGKFGKFDGVAGTATGGMIGCCLFLLIGLISKSF